MIYALDEMDNRIEAIPQATARCPLCQEEVIAKCGDVKIWHWAHVSLEDCDSWYEPESAWHLGWKSLVGIENREVVVGSHRVDMVGTKGIFIELQHSSLSIEEVAERERFYGNMIWIFDLSECLERFDFRDRDGYKSFRWKHPRAYITHARKPKFLDFGNGFIFAAKHIYQNAPVGGWGQWMTNQQFHIEYLQPSLVLI